MSLLLFIRTGTGGKNVGRRYIKRILDIYGYDRAGTQKSSRDSRESPCLSTSRCWRRDFEKLSINKIYKRMSTFRGNVMDLLRAPVLLVIVLAIPCTLSPTSAVKADDALKI